MDKIELALSRYTDFFRFERLCIEVMGYYGYPRIRKIGGYQDDGIDALSSELYLDDTRETRIFQFTMEKNTKGKIENTVKKLIKNKIDYDELILVTSQTVNNIDRLSKSFRFEYAKTLQIYDLSTFVTVISRHQDILERYFPKLNAQIEADFYNENIFSESSEDQLSMSMIKSTLLYSLSPRLSTQQQRKNLFDKAVLSLISMKEVGMSIKNIIEEFLQDFGKLLMDSQVKASLDRLVGKGLCSYSDGIYKPSKKAKAEMSLGIAHVEQRTDALIMDIISQTHVIADGIKCSQEDDKQMMFNIQKTLNMFFKFYGTDLALDVNTIVPGFERQEELVKLLSDSLQPELAECLVYSLGCIINNPSDEQAETISLWAKAFIGTQIMKLDPMLSDFQKNTFSEKLYILDTDFVLNCMVKHGKYSEVYSFLLAELLRMKCRVYIPENVIREVIVHAEYSSRNYNYFKKAFEAIDEAVIYEKVKNVFVIDYFISQLKRNQDFTEESFSSYISNIYEPSDPYNYMIKVLQSTLPKGVIIADISLYEEANIDSVECESLTQSIYQETIKTAKASYRSDEENMQIARTDAELYLIARNLNKTQPSDKNRMLLYGRAYLITNSTRSIRCAKVNGIFSTVVAKPNVLIALISEIGIFNVSNKSIINLLGNPFLAEIVEQNWDEMKVLVEAGVDLRGKTLTRLKRDLKHEIHILMTQENPDRIDTENDTCTSVSPMNNVEEYIHYANDIRKKGYRLIPSVEKLIEDFEKMKTDKDNLEKINKKIQEEIDRMGKKKQRYLNRINKA